MHRYSGMPAGPSMMAFPWVLSVFEIHGYDFYKVLESFIKAEPSLTKEVVKVSNIQLLDNLRHKQLIVHTTLHNEILK